MSRASSVDFPTSPLSRRVGVQTPSWVTFQEENHENNTVHFPEVQEATLSERIRNATARVFCLPFKPLRAARLSNRKDNFEMEVSSNKRNAIDPAEAYQTKMQLLEAELERVNKKLEDLRRDYGRLYIRAQHSDSRCIEARSKFRRLRESYEDLARVAYETYGKEQYRALRAKIEQDKEKIAKKRFMVSQSMLVTTEDTDTDSAMH